MKTKKQEDEFTPAEVLETQLKKRAKTLEKEIQNIDDMRWNEKVRELRNIENKLFRMKNPFEFDRAAIFNVPQKNQNSYNPNLNR